MIRRAAPAFLFLLICAGALMLRLPALDHRPMHGDESVHALKFDDVWERGVYHYDPNEFHGPTLYYAALPSVWLHGRHHLADTTEADFRLATVLFGVGLVALLVLLADGLGWPAAAFAGLLTALSPAFVFYSRYFIQETLLAFFTLGVLACGWRYLCGRKPAWAVAVGLSAGLMVATKETCVFAFASMAAAAALSLLWSRRFDSRPLNLRPYWNLRHSLLAAATGLLAACLLLSGFLSNPRGPLDFLRSFTPWVERAHATGLHQHPWFYYFAVLGWTHRVRGPVWTEGFILLLALVGLVVALRPRREPMPEGNTHLLRFIGFYTIVLTLLYTAVPYKTPWCVLSFLDGMILLAGVGAVALFRRARNWPLKIIVAAVLLAGCGHLAWLCHQTNTDYDSDNRNPYVYAQPSEDLVEMAKRIDAIAAANPQHEKMVVNVISVDNYYWPLPWYLRHLQNVGYWTEIPKTLDAPVVLASPQFDEDLTKRLGPKYLMTGIHSLRPEVFLETFVREDAWKAYLDKRKLEKKPKNEDEE